MNRTEILNRVAKWGLILGVAMSISKVIEIEMLMKGTVTMTLMIIVEMIISVALYLYLCYRANIERLMSLDNPSEYGFRSVLNYSMVISIFAGVIVGIATHVYINSQMGGYAGYVESMRTAMLSIMDSAQMDAESREEALKALDGYTNVEGVDQISILESVVSTTMNYIIGGFIAGLAVTRFVKRVVNNLDNNEYES